MSVFSRLLGLMRPFIWQTTLAVLLGALMIATSMGLLGMAAYLIADATYKPLLIMLSIPIYVVRLASLTRAAARYGERMASHSLTFRLLARLRTLVYRRLVPLAPAVLLRHRSADLLTRLVADVEELQHIYVRMVGPTIVAVLIAALTTVTFGIFSPLLAWAALLLMLLAGVALPLVMARLERRAGARKLALRAELNTHLADAIQGVPDLLAFGAEETARRQLSRIEDDIAREQRRTALVSGFEQGLTDFIASLAVWGMLVLSIPLVTRGTVGGVYLAFLALLLMASFEALQPLGQAFQFAGRAVSAGQRIFSVIDEPPPVRDPVEPLSTPPMRAAMTALALEDVRFTYPGETLPALDGVSVSVPTGARVALVGPSGAGKSTVLHLLARMWDPQRGRVLLAGGDIRDYSLEGARAMLGVVSQDTYIFNNTIRANLLLARPDAVEDAIWSALERARLADFVRKLPDGLDTWVGEQGQRLSGGERQRLAIARALLKDAPVLVLDEPTANLDAHTEREVLDALDDLMTGRTTLMATHRLVAMERMDDILVLEHGRVAERGTHKRLIAAGGLYARLFDIQNAVLVDSAGVWEGHDA